MTALRRFQGDRDDDQSINKSAVENMWKDERATAAVAWIREQ